MAPNERKSPQQRETANTRKNKGRRRKKSLELECITDVNNVSCQGGREISFVSVYRVRRLFINSGDCD